MSQSEGDGEASDAEIPLRVALGTALVSLVAVRLLPFGSVFRGRDVVLLSNDPYAYLSVVERALTGGAVGRGSSAVNWLGEPFLTWTLAFFSALSGGVDHAPFVLAWYPVFTALVSGVLVFVLARIVTDDVRIALTAVVVLAVTPLHVSRTALGAADHHAFDYMWLSLTATALTWLLVRTDAHRRPQWQMAGVLGFGVAGQTVAWEGSPLMLAPTAAAVGAASVILVRRDDATCALTPVVVGFGLAALAVQAVHRALGWQSPFVAAVPVLLFLGGLALLGVVEGVDRSGGSWRAFLGTAFGGLALGGLALWLVSPGLVGTALDQVDGFTAYVEGLRTTGIGETTPLTGAFGPILGPLVLLGFSPFLGLPAMVWGVVRGWREREPEWFILASYVLWFLGLAFLQRRWAVQLGLFLSVFAAVGFIAFAHWLALVLPPVPLRDGQPADQDRIEPPDRQRLALLGGMGTVALGGSTLYSGYILSRLTIDDSAYEAAVWMRDYADERGWSYPQNYVLASWGRVRMFNYFVNGESRSYGYARRNYEDFVFGDDPAGWYERFRGRVGFVVTRPRVAPDVLNNQTRLHDNYGSANDSNGGVGHYRAMWESPDGEVKVFTLVPGAAVIGIGPAETVLELSTSVRLAGTGRTVEYRRRVETDSGGVFSVVLAHPGEYVFADRDTTVTVTEAAVRDGTVLTSYPQ